MSDNGILSDKMSDKLVVSDKKHSDTLLDYLSRNGEISASEAAKIVGCTAKTARRVLLQLVDAGIVTATGANRNRKYRIKR
jgi:predicted ArsR family transcriptional regulator